MSKTFRNLFELDIEEFITLERLKEMIPVDMEDFENCRKFISDNLVLELSVPSKDSMPVAQREISVNFLNMIRDNFSKSDTTQRKTIGVNYTRGYHFNLSQAQLSKDISKARENAEESQNQLEVKDSFLFFISKQSEGFSHYIDSDFVILKIDHDLASVQAKA